MEKSLKDRGFIVERGFKKMISHFSEMLKKRGWQSLGKHKDLAMLHWLDNFLILWWKRKEIRYMSEDN